MILFSPQPKCIKAQRSCSLSLLLIMVVAVLTAIPFSAFAASGPTKLISWGWNAPTTAWMRANLSTMRQVGFDGVVVTSQQPLGYYTSAFFLSTTPVTMANVQSEINDFAAIAGTPGWNSFYAVNASSSGINIPDWFDDWSTPLANMTTLGQLILQGHLKGFVLDTEQYGDKIFDYATRKYAATKTLAQYKAQAFLRGQQVVQALNAVTPTIDILTPYGYSLTPIYTDYELLASFIDGIVQGVASGTILHEVSEWAYAYERADQFSSLKSSLLSTAQSLTSNTAKLTTNYRIGFGVWVDYGSIYHDCATSHEWSTTDFTCNWFLPADFQTSVTQGLLNADAGSYLWIYDQIPNWWTGASLPAAYLTALKNGKGGGATVSGATVSVSATSVSPGASVTVTVADGPRNTTDWVGLYPIGAPDIGGYTIWKYLSDTQTPPSTGVASATLHFTMPTTAGQYTFRFFANDGYTLLATSVTVTVSGVTVSGPSVSATPTTVARGGAETVTVANGPGNTLDWVGLYAVGASDTAFIAWKYLSDSQAPPAKGVTAATLHFTIPTSPGQYEFRLFPNDGYSPRLAKSGVITVR